MQIVKLRCDAMVNPIGFAFDSPRLSWEVASAGRSERQSAYRLQIALDESFAAPLLDERVESDESVNVPLTLALAPRTRYFWRVKIWNGAGEESPWAEPAYFETAKMDEPWRAQWIRSPENEGFPALRRAFQLENKPIRRARAYACGVGLYHLYLNGEKVGDEELTPNFNPYNHYLQYQTYDITSLLRPGENAVGALLGNGYYKGRVSWPNMPRCTCLYGNELALIAELVVDYADGTQQTIVTDETWKAGRSPLLRAEIYDGEVYDARLELPGWNAPGFDDSHWLSTAHAGVDAALLQPRRSVPVRVVEERPAVQVLRTPKGEDVVDFGQNCAGWVRLSLNAPAGVEIRVQYGEMLDKDGNFYRENMRTALAEMVYTTREGEQSYAPLFTFFGFRYIRVTGWPGALSPEQFTQCVVHSDLERTGEFECSDARVNRLFENVIWGQRSNFVDVPTDCPQRDERMGWMNDATVRFEETPYNFDIGRLFPKVVRDLLDVQDESGAICCTAPFAFGGRPADPVCSSFLVAGWEAYMHTGNLDILREGYDGFKAWNDYLASRSQQGIVDYSYYGDWASPAYACEGEDGAKSSETPGILMSTGYHYFNARLLARMAAALGQEDEATEQNARADAIREAFLAKWWDEESGKVATGSQACQAFALWLGILPEEGRAKAAKALHDDLVAREYRFTTGNLCTRYMMDALTQWGYLEDAWALITRETYPSWGFMLQNEATTVWERFELKKNPGMNSHNHPMFGAVGYWFYAYLAGVKPLEAGWKRVAIHPYMPKNLLSAQATVETPRGDVSVRWVKRYGQAHLYVQIPCGAQADVTLPQGTQSVFAGFHHFTWPLDAK